MEKRFRFIFIGFLIANIPILAQVDSAIKQEILNIIHYDTQIDLSENRGFIVGIIDGDSTFIIPFDDVTLPKLTASTQFEIGGLTKVFMATLCQSLAKQGVLDLSSSIPALESLGNELADITWQELIVHHSGLPKMPFGIGEKQMNPAHPYANYSKADLVDYLKQIESLSPKQFSYSHLNYAVLEWALESKFNEPWYRLLHTHILKPLNLRHTHYGMSTDSLTPGYGPAGHEVEPWKYASYAGSLGLISNLDDLLSFTRAQWESGPLTAIAKGIHQPNYTTDMGKGVKLAQEWYAFPSRKHYTVYSHGGKTEGHRSFIGFVKETRTGVIVLSRSAQALEDLGLLILRMINKNWKRKK